MSVEVFYHFLVCIFLDGGTKFMDSCERLRVVCCHFLELFFTSLTYRALFGSLITFVNIATNGANKLFLHDVYFILVIIVMLFVKTARAYSFIIELYVINPVAVYHLFFIDRGYRFFKEVGYTSAFLAIEMYMCFRDTIVTYTVLVYCYHSCSVVFRQKPQCVIYSCAA